MKMTARLKVKQKQKNKRNKFTNNTKKTTNRRAITLIQEQFPLTDTRM